ncbi:N-acetyl-gamma-glutamyl-phosphate reductase [Campylobacter sp. MIT 12-8780]|uniref:N-acetyl-gamma-glutamyl-phosphate reductase n=1 Tax=Campylobacter sp. MIT 12-8780 TaxID=2202200 RepID=UPI00115D1158|nr:N-acetyl-gamma-glutamyl-phosphate reductase [Campylobacter sp. MIT 12-8780]TQR41545.1 N-acetyl-gamma-glutamyl-phosphate reductase [Campylobacter sp. MIT 12-8780]
MDKIKIAIFGSNGYTGYELVRLLLRHPKAELCYLGSRAYKDEPYFKVYPNTFKKLDLLCKDEDINEVAKEVDLIFTATPQGFCAGVMNESLLQHCKIIDLSADFRLKNANIYEKWYKLEHKAKGFLNEAVYGLSELKREEIKKARLIANPGCYTTTSILALYPLVKHKLIDLNSIIIDAKSGASGAGRGAKEENLFCEINENFKAYGIASHRHTPEIEQELSLAANENITLQFTPHLVPMQRGILASIYTKFKGKINELRSVYENTYKDENFIRILPVGILPQTRFVKGTNFLDINFVFDERTQNLIIIAALDNLLKGAAGQAVQNMNLAFGFDESLGLENLGLL